jgi:putative sterol carrier protein
LWHGQCREAGVEKDKNAKTPAFVMSGGYSKWKRVVTAKLDPIQALMTGQLKLKGNMVMVMKNVKAAQEMVRACTRIDAAFPDEQVAAPAPG